MCNLFASAKDSLISLHVSDSFVGPRVPDGEDTEPISKVCIFVFDMKDVQQNATQVGFVFCGGNFFTKIICGNFCLANNISFEPFSTVQRDYRYLSR